VTTVQLENTRVLQESWNVKVVQLGGTKQKHDSPFVCHGEFQIFPSSHLKNKSYTFCLLCEIFYYFLGLLLFPTLHLCPAFLAPQMLNLVKQIVRNVQSVDLHPEPLPMTRCAPNVKKVNTKMTSVNQTAKIATWEDGAM
tara:strand:+ start:402 stop:821 length:420 start_codon:yes stop_codon:yes gene_type:complete